jgi:hypothetical protein
MTTTIAADVAVHGNHMASCCAAIAAAQAGAAQGKRVVLFAGHSHFGTPFVEGLGVYDLGTYYTRNLGNWIVNEFLSRQSAALQTRLAIRRLPSAMAEQVMKQMLDFYDVLVYDMSDIASVAVDGSNNITSVTLASGVVITATNWICGDEDGDLTAGAGVPMIVGREASATYSESLAGYQPVTSTFFAVDTGDGDGGLLAGLISDPGLSVGDADSSVSVMGWRLPITKNPALRLDWPKPDSYDTTLFELRWRVAQASWDDSTWYPFAVVGNTAYGKVDMNTEVGFGLQHAWPTNSLADRATAQDTMFREWAGYMWRLANDTSVPSRIRTFMGQWGLCRDEHISSSITPVGWPEQIYRRGTRRLSNPGTRMTQADVTTDTTKTDTIATGYYSMDDHTRNQVATTVGGLTGFFKDGINNLASSARQVVPYEIPFSCMYDPDYPNLLVPNCHGATAVAYASTRIDLHKADMGAAAGYAAMKSVLTSTAIQSLVVADLQTDLVALGQVIHPSVP